MERIWGGRKLAEIFGKDLPPNTRIGESWEIVDRLDVQSIVLSGPLKGKTLHDLWTDYRLLIFGDVAAAERFPLLIKLLDAREMLSLQVHPPASVATELGGEAKSEFWYVAAADRGAELLLGFQKPTSRGQFEKALRNGTALEHVHKIPTKAGDAVFLPAGRLHAISAGHLLIEVQQNSDTTYRVFDWNRTDDDGKLRQLHITQALRSINFADVRPGLCEPKGESLLSHRLFEIDKWALDRSRESAPFGQFAIVCCLTGNVACAGIHLKPGEIFLVPAQIPDRELQPLAPETTVLRVTIP